ncbi:MAG: hypothetical protein WBB65_01290 [Anaerolineales bacterium]
MKKNIWIGIAATVLLAAALVVVGVVFYNIGASRGAFTAVNLEGIAFPGGPLSQKVYIEGGDGFPVLLHRFPPFLMGLIGFLLLIVLLRALARLIFFPFFGFGAMRGSPRHPGWRPMGRYACRDWDEMDTPAFIHKWHSQMHDAEESDEADTPKA